MGFVVLNRSWGRGKKARWFRIEISKCHGNIFERNQIADR
jgi:hypothetical protein